VWLKKDKEKNEETGRIKGKTNLTLLTRDDPLRRQKAGGKRKREKEK
jgi:hypothetical protein